MPSGRKATVKRSLPVSGVEDLHVACVQIKDADDLVSPTIHVPIRGDPPPGAHRRPPRRRAPGTLATLSIPTLHRPDQHAPGLRPGREQAAVRRNGQGGDPNAFDELASPEPAGSQGPDLDATPP